MENIKVFSCSKSADKFTKEICDYLKIDMGQIERLKFKNDNNFVQILETVRDKDVFLIQTTSISAFIFPAHISFHGFID